MSQQFKIHLFLKFGEEKHIRALYERGEIYMNPLAHFRKLEQKERGDPYEGVSFIQNVEGEEIREFRIEPPGIKPINLNPTRFQLKGYPDSPVGNAFCLYMISSRDFQEHTTHTISSRIREFGDSCLLIKDNEFFYREIKKALHRNGYRFAEGPVDYMDFTKGELDIDPFKKHINFSHQNEFRFVIFREEADPIKLYIPPLIGKAELLPSEKIIEGLKGIIHKS